MRIQPFGLLVLFLAAAACGAARSGPQRFEFRQIHMGVETRLVLYAASGDRAARAAEAAFHRVATLDSLLSDYRADSELKRVVAGAGGPPLAVSEELVFVLTRAGEFARLSDGRFDVTAGPLVQLWRQARRSGVLPDPAAREAAMRLVGWRFVELDPAAGTVRLARPGMRLDLGGIAKGYAADEALRTLRAHGVGRALVEMGGDIVIGDPPPGRHGWSVHVAHAGPGQEAVVLANAAVSSSGDTEQFVEIAGERFSHVVDLRTGLGLRTRAAATVIAPDGITADALSTLLTLVEPETARALAAEHFPDATVHLRHLGPTGAANP